MTAPDRKTLAAAGARALANVANLPKWMQVHAVGRDLTPVAEVVVDALLAGPLAQAAAPGPDGEAVERVRAWLAEATVPTPEDVIHEYGKWRDGRHGKRHYVQTSALRRSDLALLAAAVDRLTAERDRARAILAASASQITGHPPFCNCDDCYNFGREGLPSFIEHHLHLLDMNIVAVRTLTRERDEARDLAFRAAFGPEEGAEPDWGVGQYEGDEIEVLYRGMTEAEARHLAQQRQPFGGIAVCRASGPWKPTPAPSPGSGEDGGDGR